MRKENKEFGQEFVFSGKEDWNELTGGDVMLCYVKHKNKAIKQQCEKKRISPRGMCILLWR